MKRTLAMALTALGVAALAACGVPDSGGGTAGAEPIKLYAFGTSEAAAFSFPEIEDGVKASIAAVNAAGGVKGRPLELVDFCNDKNEPAAAADCARKAVASRAAAAVGVFSVQGASFVPILEAAKLPLVGMQAITPTESNSPIVFLIDGGGYAGFVGQAPVMAERIGAKRFALVATELASSTANLKYLERGVGLVGGEVATTITVPPNTVDLAPYVSRIAAANPDAVLFATTTNDVVKYWNAANALKFGVPAAITAGMASPDLIAAGGPAALNSYVSAQLPNEQGDDPDVVRFREDMAKYAPGGKISAFSLRAWASVQLVAAVGERASDPGASADLLEALNTTQDMKFLWLPKLSFTGNSGVPDFSRGFVLSIFPGKVEAGPKVVPVGEPVDLKAYRPS